MKKLFMLIFLIPALATAQYKEAAGGGFDIPRQNECIPFAERTKVQEAVATNVEYLKKNGTLKTFSKSTATTFDWPLKQDPDFDYYSIYSIFNFVDHNPAVPNLLQDYNCGTRTYDLSNGYNHAGIDIVLWPFTINMMQSGQAHVVAAAAGTIVSKHDGEFDLNCSIAGAPANHIIIEHSDGYRTWYWHMKSGSLTSKNIGDPVVAGEFLGLVGSSGSSTTPHLHFEVHNAADSVIDPFNGPCNPGTSMWNNQLPYHDPQINTLLTHSAPPVFQNCPQPDITNLQDTFLPGSTISFAAYYHDQEAGLISNFSLTRPDASVYNTWAHSGGTVFYTQSYWYWTYNIPATQPFGAWKFRATYEGETYEHKFYILDPLNVTNTELQAGLIYPNPASNTLYFSCVQAAEVMIIDVFGKVVLNESNFRGHTLDISSLNSGMYFVKIVNGNKITTQKISVQR